MESEPIVKAYESYHPLALSFNSPNVLSVRDHPQSSFPFYLLFSRDFDDRTFYHEGARAQVYFEVLERNTHDRKFPENLLEIAQEFREYVQNGFFRREIFLPDFSLAYGVNGSQDIPGFHSVFNVPLRKASHTNTLLDLLKIPHPRHIESFDSLVEEVQRTQTRRNHRKQMKSLDRELQIVA